MVLRDGKFYMPIKVPMTRSGVFLGPIFIVHGRAPTRNTLVLMRLQIMALLSDLSPEPSCELIQAIQNDHSNAELLFRNRFERAIRVLAKRRIGCDFEVYAEAVIAATIHAIRDSIIKRDQDLPNLIRQELDALLSALMPDSFCAERSTDPAQAKEPIHDTLARLLRCSTKEREVLRLFYVAGEDEITICRTQDISLNRFRSLRASVKRAVGQSHVEKLPRKLPTPERPGSSTNFSRRASVGLS